MYRMLRFSLLTSLVFMSAWVAQANNGSPVLEKYCNSRYGFCVEYPESLLTQKHISANNDGLAVLSADGNYQLRVYGYFNVMGWGVNEEYVDFLEVTQSNTQAEVKELEKNFSEDQFEVLLMVGKKLHYERTILKGNHFVSLSLEVNRKGNMSLEESKGQLKQILDEIQLALN